MAQKDEKSVIIKKIKDNPHLTLHEIATELGISFDTFYRRMKILKIEHGRKRGARKGTLKPLKIS